MSKELYEKSFPRYIPFGSGKQPLPEGKVLVSGLRTPKYGLGWMVRVPRVKDLNPNYFSLLFNVIWPNWRAKNFKPATEEELERIGYQVPELWQIGNHCVWISIARNHHNMMRIVPMEKNRVKMVNQAMVALGLTPETFRPFTPNNLMWLRWEKGRRFPDIDYPCVAEHLWISRRGGAVVGPGSEGSGVASTHPQVSKELGKIIECRHFRHGAPRLCVPTSSEESQQ
ncbi:hypothetical protein D9611_011344 [Ephemerocybe angulata]|uniref:Uncharacterized protein n=1 Tax=Ephemerocybe angulata TaxID=980116 RepID=A0A8H5F1S0_9AGAR|nr:hypothetical protein D9611_011344 [Tulosesus angulatus]